MVTGYDVNIVQQHCLLEAYSQRETKKTLSCLRQRYRKVRQIDK